MPPLLLYYGDLVTTNSTLDQQLKERDAALRVLNEHLRIAQGKMKKAADQKRWDVELQVDDWVFLKIQPYHQSTLRQRRNEKLSPKFFRPYCVVEKVSSVAYKLELPPAATIHIVFHIFQLKKVLGQH